MDGRDLWAIFLAIGRLSYFILAVVDYLRDKPDKALAAGVIAIIVHLLYRENVES